MSTLEQEGRKMEEEIRKEGGSSWMNYTAVKENYLSSLMTASFKSGRVLSRKKAIAVWYERLAAFEV